MAAQETIHPPHVPVMLAEVLSALSPHDDGTYVDGTFGAGGYTRAILAAARTRVIAIDRDPSAIRGGQALVAEYSPRLSLREGRFADMEALVGDERIDGVVLDIGISSMQIDEAERGFSFLRDGPLDMRMAQAGTSAADAINTLPQETLSNIIYVFGEEPRARAIA
ncbi:16S rRNA (cytosine(1402)-N(4))-methyltransferase, partial [Aestuariivirga sp.]|uniref:16S rRNA (cytosine(1402)-N(4))-methyltransferase n=1 Tax=Aestuariivirga sp. TaxID=2650926 RepID=UPI0035AE7BF7